MLRNTKYIVYLDVMDYQSGLTKEVFQSWFPGRRIFPGSTDRDLAYYSREALRAYDLFFGRFSTWQFDFLGPDCKRLTVLEPPALRIVNSYLRFREEGIQARIRGEQLAPNDFRFLAAELLLDEFLNIESRDKAEQILAVFDNFYTYFFGTRTANSRYLIKDVNAYYDPGLTTQQVLSNAIRNIEDHIPVYFLDDVAKLLSDIGHHGNNVDLRGSRPRARFGTISLVRAALSKNSGKSEELLHMYSEFDATLFHYFH